MPEGVEGPQLSEREKGSTAELRQEIGKNQNAEARQEKSVDWVDSVRQEMRQREVANNWWLEDITKKNPEEAEQYKELWENAKKLRDNLGQFSEDDPNIHASNETKQKLEQLEQRGLVVPDVDRNNMNISTHERSATLFLSTVMIGGALEGINYLAGGETRVCMLNRFW